ncbi:hypothetical protein FPOA_03493 [Fusarium poae]|uniref:Uncharacterized protein n=1 Tax=Fusarium poae TaxID=36050 RepID=A0A1B8BA10_FUSPO|nr:hypothetical protein FPOA_03493 [Fusarium poae]
MEKRTSPVLSLHEQIIRHPELSVHPLRWTARHLDLMCCTFQEIDIPPEAETGKYQEDTVENVEELTREGSIGCWKSSPFCCLFKGEESRLKHHKGVSPSFLFPSRNPHTLECNILFPEPATFAAENDRTADLIIGFVAYDNVAVRRRSRCFPNWHPNSNGSAQDLYLRNLRKYSPEIWFEDPYLICNMLSLAQIQWREVRCEFYPVRLVVAHDDELTNAYVYYAEFPEGILDQLLKPVLRTEATWPTIYYTKIPYEPHGTFADRITKALLNAKVEISEKEDEAICKRVKVE